MTALGLLPAWVVGLALVAALPLESLLGRVARATAAPHRSAETERPATAVCPVCRVREGTVSREPVRAIRVRDGITYGFCSLDCAREFERDPDRYRAGPAAADSISGPAAADSLDGLAESAAESGTGAFSGVSITPT